MTGPDPKLKAKKPVPLLQRPLEIDCMPLIKAVSKATLNAATGRWPEAASDAVEATCALGLATEPGELAFLLIKRALIRAVFDLLSEGVIGQLSSVKAATAQLEDQVGTAVARSDVGLDSAFLRRPGDLPILKSVQQLLDQWLVTSGLPAPTAQSVVARLPNYFVYAVNDEWRRNSRAYRSLIDALETPFSTASERELAWMAYSASLVRRVNEGMLGEPLSLSQLFVNLNAYYVETIEQPVTGRPKDRTRRERRSVVVSLREELDEWLARDSSSDSIRVLSGGPGSGKSSFARMWAAELASDNRRVLFVPLHLIYPTEDLVEEVGRFVREEGILSENPLDPDGGEPDLLVIFDGLDELANQGKASAETTRAFLRQVERMAEIRNQGNRTVRVLICGRQLIVQENELEFRRARQILTVLPYWVGASQGGAPALSLDHPYHDPDERLWQDLRDTWWREYGSLIGMEWSGLPQELARADLDELTSQPLLNYLVALALSRNEIDFAKDIDLNIIYEDLIRAIYDRGYENKRIFPSIQHLSFPQFLRILEEIGLAAWHGDGRTTTARDIEDHCKEHGLDKLLNPFMEGARTGVTQLLAAFFFRKWGDVSGDPTFVFTHKSFAEYLAARRVVGAVERIIRELGRRDENPDEGWDQREALRYWAQICGPRPISHDMYVFLRNEVSERAGGDVSAWQEHITNLFSQMLKYGMPMEQMTGLPFKTMLFQSRNAEESLLAVLNAIALLTGAPSVVTCEDATSFGEWLRRIQGQRMGRSSSLAMQCLSLLDLTGSEMAVCDFFRSNLRSSKLTRVSACRADFGEADLTGVDLSDAILSHADFSRANLRGANLRGARLDGASFVHADLTGTNLAQANLEGANLHHANLERANCDRAVLRRANIVGANLTGWKHHRTDVTGVIRQAPDQ